MFYCFYKMVIVYLLCFCVIVCVEGDVFEQYGDLIVIVENLCELDVEWVVGCILFEVVSVDIWDSIIIWGGW